MINLIKQEEGSVRNHFYKIPEKFTQLTKKHKDLKDGEVITDDEGQKYVVVGRIFGQDNVLVKEVN